jgi:hypothetical protein
VTFVRHRATQIVAALVLGLLLGAGTVAIFEHRDGEVRRVFDNGRNLGPLRPGGPMQWQGRNGGPVLPRDRDDDSTSPSTTSTTPTTPSPTPGSTTPTPTTTAPTSATA